MQAVTGATVHLASVDQGYTGEPPAQDATAHGIQLDDDVIPDVVWMSAARLNEVLRKDGKLYGAPDRVVEVLSPGASNERRHRDAKRKLYSQRGVEAYWSADARQRRVDIYRQRDGALDQLERLSANEMVRSPLLPGFACRVEDLFAGYGPVLRNALTLIGIVLLAAALGIVIAGIGAFFFLPDVQLIPLPLTIGIVGVLLLFAGFAIGWLGPRWWWVAVVAVWPFAIVGLGMMPVQPVVGLGWLAIPPVLTLLGGYWGRRLRTARSEAVRSRSVLR